MASSWLKKQKQNQQETNNPISVIESPFPVTVPSD